MGCIRIVSSIPAETSVSVSGVFFAGLPQSLEQVRGGAVDPKHAFAKTIATRVDSPLPQPPVTFFESAGPVSHSNRKPDGSYK